MSKSTRLVKGAYNGIISGIVLLLVMLVALLVYLNFFVTPPVDYEKVDVVLGEYNGNNSYGGYIKDDDPETEDEYITIKCSQSSMGFSVLSMRASAGQTITIYKSEYGYTLYNPSNGKYDREVYDSSYNKGYEQANQ